MPKGARATGGKGNNQPTLQARRDARPRGHERFATLDGMRGLAALVVAGCHIVDPLRVGNLPQAHIAVDFFFMLSGFVLAQTYDDRLGATLRPGAFILKRIIRLHPLLVLGFVIAAAIEVVHGSSGTLVVRDLFAGAFMVPMIWPPSGAAFPLDGPAWSLFDEYVVNVVFALIAVALTWRRLWIVLGIGFVLLCLLASSTGLHSSWRGGDIASSLLRIIYPFFAGVFVSRLMRTKRLAVPTVSPSIAMAVLAAILMAPSTGFDTLAQLMTISVIFPLLILVGAYSEGDRAANRWLLRCGALSYPVYVLHTPIAILLLPILASLLPPLATLIIVLACVLGVSFVLLRYYDEPLRAWLSFRARNWQMPVTQALPESV